MSGHERTLGSEDEIYRNIAQSVEQRADNAEVDGPNPSIPTKKHSDGHATNPTGLLNNSGCFDQTSVRT